MSDAFSTLLYFSDYEFALNLPGAASQSYLATTMTTKILTPLNPLTTEAFSFPVLRSSRSYNIRVFLPCLILLHICMLLRAEPLPLSNLTGRNDSNFILSEIFPPVVLPILARLEAPLQVRASLYVHLSLWNAWVAYHPNATDIFGRTVHKRPPIEHTTLYANVAMLQALYTLLSLAPSSFAASPTLPFLRKYLDSYGLLLPCRSQNCADPFISAALAVGTAAGSDISILTKNDGWNDAGDLPGTSFPGASFADTTGYQPANDADRLKFPFRWQPVVETDGFGYFYSQRHVVPHAGNTFAFTLNSTDMQRRTARPPYACRNARRQKPCPRDLRVLRRSCLGVLRRASRLNERRILLAELFDNKVRPFRSTRYPDGVPSIVPTLRNIVPTAMGWSLERDMTFALGMHFAMLDAMVVAWKEKCNVDAVRPSASSLEYALGRVSVTVLNASAHKTVRDVRHWKPLLRNMPHSEFPSASACLCTAVVEHALRAADGRNNISHTVVIKKGASALFPGILPKNNLHLRFRTLTQWKVICGRSRLWGGVHFEKAVKTSQKLCNGIGTNAHSLAQAFLNGNPDLTWTSWFSQDTLRHLEIGDM